MSFHLVARKMDGRHAKDTAGLCGGPCMVTIRVSTHDVPATTRSPYCTLTLNPPRRGLSDPLFTDEETQADRVGNQPKAIQRVSGTPRIQTPPFWFQSHYKVPPYVSSKLCYPSELPGGLYNTDSQAPACISAGEVCFLQQHLEIEVDLFPSALPLW